MYRTVYIAFSFCYPAYLCFFSISAFISTFIPFIRSPPSSLHDIWYRNWKRKSLHHALTIWQKVRLKIKDCTFLLDQVNITASSVLKMTTLASMRLQIASNRIREHSNKRSNAFCSARRLQCPIESYVHIQTHDIVCRAILYVCKSNFRRVVVYELALAPWFNPFRRLF